MKPTVLKAADTRNPRAPDAAVFVTEGAFVSVGVGAGNYA